MPDRIELTPSQRTRCNRLIRRLCANYDNGNCLPLDEGDGCVCVQMISLSLICKYFRNAVLPADKELCAEIFRQRTFIIASSAKRLLCRTPTDKNTAWRAVERFTESRKTRAQESAERTVRGTEMPCLQGLF